MKRVRIDHPAIREMISRRSGGDRSYVDGVRAFLEARQEPHEDTVRHQGYMDAHDMSAHLWEIYADLYADEIDEDEELAKERQSLARRSSPTRASYEGIRLTLKEVIDKRKAQRTPTLRRNPTIDAKLDRFIAENPDLRAYYEQLSKEELVRKLILGKMQRSEYANERNAEIRTWVEEHPEIKERIEAKIRNVPAQNRERAFINAAKTEAMNQTVQHRNGNGIRA